MAVSKAGKNYFSFVKGIITEASALSFPEDASIDEANFVLHTDGSRERREGWDYESNYSLSTEVTEASVQNGRVSSYRWTAPNSNSSLEFLCVVSGGTLYIFDSTSQNSISAGFKTSIDLSVYKAPTRAPVSTAHTDMTSGEGRLFIVNENMEPLYVTYNEDADTFSVTEINCQIRDIKGLTNDYALDFRPSTLINTHNYNLRNQGFHNIILFFNHFGVYPSLSDSYHAGLVQTGSTPDTVNWSGSYYSNNYALHSIDQPRGYFVLDLFYQDRASRGVAFGSIPVEEIPSRFSTVTFHAGRVWFSGLSTQGYGNKLYFSQVLSSIDKVGKFYQAADPTNVDDPDVVATDGGEITIPNANHIVKLVPLGRNLIVIADNGVWQVIGGEFGFTAVENNTTKVSTIGAISAPSVVQTESSVFFWGEGGLYVISAEQVSGELQVQNLSEQTIQSLYVSIPQEHKKNASGIYDHVSKRIFWFYNESSSVPYYLYVNRYTTVLVLDTLLGAFYKYTMYAGDDIFVSVPFLKRGLIESQSAELVLVDEDAVQVGGENVEITFSSAASSSNTVANVGFVRKSGSTNYYLAIMEINNSQMKDFITYYTYANAKDYTSFLETGYTIPQSLGPQFSTTYLHLAFQKTENGVTLDANGNFQLQNASACTIRGKWDWNTTSTGNKWSNTFEGYRFRRPYIISGINDTIDTGESVIYTRNKVRGRGRALSLRFESQTGKKCHILGWTTNYGFENAV